MFLSVIAIFGGSIASRRIFVAVANAEARC
jgi:hypothetical protein